MLRFIKIFGLFVGSFVLTALVAEFDAQIGIFVAVGFVLIGMVALSKQNLLPLLSNKNVAVVFIILNSSVVFALFEKHEKQQQAELATLRNTKPSEYLSRICSNGLVGKCLSEYGILNKAEYTNELERRLSLLDSLSYENIISFRDHLAEQRKTDQSFRKEHIDKVNSVLSAQEYKRLVAKVRSAPEDYLRLEDMNWNIGGFGVVMLASFAIKNESPIPIKDILLRCTLYGKSGTSLGTKDHTIYDIVYPNKRISLKEVNLGVINQQSANASCRIVTAVGT
jgi:hypothetical protein